MSVAYASPLAPTATYAKRSFYAATAVVAAALTLIGFHHFYLGGMSYPGRPITPPIRGLVITHGVIMTVWILLFLVQPLLVALGRRSLHRTLGKVGALVALGVIVTGFWIAIQSARVAPPGNIIWGLTPTQFMAVPFFAGVAFTIFTVLGIAYRRTLSIHKPMMMLATYSVMSAPISRIDPLSQLYVGTIWDRLLGPFFVTQLLLGVFLIVHAMIHRTLDRRLASGFIALTLGYALVMQFARTDLWEAFAHFCING